MNDRLSCQLVDRWVMRYCTDVFSWFLPLESGLSFHRGERALRHVITQLPTDGDTTGPFGVLELPVISLRYDQTPSLCFQQLNHLADLHVGTISSTDRFPILPPLSSNGFSATGVSTEYARPVRASRTPKWPSYAFRSRSRSLTSEYSAPPKSPVESV